MADKISVKVDVMELSNALRDYEKFSSRSMPEIINATAVDAAFKANSAANIAKENAIRKADTDGRLWHVLAATGATRFGKVVRSEGNKDAAKKIFESRVRSRGYSKVLFLKMAQDLGKTLRKTVGRALPDNAKGKKAKESPVCFAELAITGIEQEHADNIIQPALQKGVDRAAKAKRERIAKKLAEGARKHSGRKKR